MALTIGAGLCVIAGQLLSPAASSTTAPVSTLKNFDFAKGTAYPARAEVRIGNVEVPPGATEAHVPVMLDRPTPKTVAARVRTRNGSGGLYGYEGTHFTKVDT